MQDRSIVGKISLKLLRKVTSKLNIKKESETHDLIYKI